MYNLLASYLMNAIYDDIMFVTKCVVQMGHIPLQQHSPNPNFDLDSYQQLEQGSSGLHQMCEL